MSQARISDILAILEGGGVLRFYWATCRVALTDHQGFTQRVDGRSYQAFLDKYAPRFAKSETGEMKYAIGEPTLIIEWRKGERK